MQSKSNGLRKHNANQKKGIVFSVDEETTLMTFLIAKLPNKSRNNIKSLLRNKQVLVDQSAVSQFDHPLRIGQKVEISATRNRMEKKFAEFTIVYEDEALLVIDKAAGLLSIATKNEKRNTAYSMLSDYVKRADEHGKIFIVHRLDRDTSGLMVFAKSEEVKRSLQEGWNQPDVEKTYAALVEGRLGKKEGTIVSYLSEDKVFRVHSSQNPKKGIKAVTHFSVIASNAGFSLLEVKLETGRKNQIRVHMEDLGHSIVGDRKYGATSSPIRRLGLHAQKLEFPHPVSGEKLHFETKIPPAFQSLINRKHK